jgi:16S rRNA (guanine966-N2)-methyltransferase
VIAGEFRGRRLFAPEGVTTRPTTDRVREAVFNSLVSMDVIRDVQVIDAFAGSGALGIEALSRGAAHCTFLERDRRALDALRSNLKALDLSSRSQVVAADAIGALANVGSAAVLFADPPYDFTDWGAVFGASPADFVVAESSRAIVVPHGWATTREKRYSRTIVTFIERSADGDPVDDAEFVHATEEPDELR